MYEFKESQLINGKLITNKTFQYSFLSTSAQRLNIIISTKQNKKLIAKHKLNFPFWHKNVVSKGFKSDLVHNGTDVRSLNFIS